jgi:hypothetical protein
MDSQQPCAQRHASLSRLWQRTSSHRHEYRSSLSPLLLQIAYSDANLPGVTPIEVELALVLLGGWFLHRLSKPENIVKTC